MQNSQPKPSSPFSAAIVFFYTDDLTDWAEEYVQRIHKVRHAGDMQKRNAAIADFNQWLTDSLAPYTWQRNGAITNANQ